MNVFLRALLVPGLMLGALAAQAQNELSNFTSTGRGGVSTTFARDYQAIGINPANLARVGSAKVAFSIGEFGLGAGSQSLTRTQLNHLIYDSELKLTDADKLSLAQSFTSDNALNANIDVNTFGLSVSLPSIGTIAVSNRQRISTHVGLNKNAAELLFLGFNAPIIKANFNADGTPKNLATVPLVSEALDGTEVQVSWLNEFNVAYGVRVLDYDMLQLTAGAGYRYIEGVGITDTRVKNGKVEAYGALSPLFDIDYGKLASNPNFNLKKRDSGLQPVGKGNGFDLGLSADVGKAVRVGVAITDMGKMTWEGNLVTANDQKLKRLRSAGIGTYNFIKEASELLAAGSDSLFQYAPGTERTANLPTKFRAGVGVRISEYFETGLDVTMPLNNVAGNIAAPFVGVGLDFKPARWVRLSTGATAGAGYAFSIPLGVTLTTKVYEAGISTRDVAGLLTSENPYVSVAMGFLRFKIGETK
ncbi:hypothetical protein F0P96_05785 [Hymenobacter busanensis]|uniref:DUF5723 domain-containing protein n=1 Tax=Hymenobacter busanensis TaxID=2607656 RepID=A0A7L5A4R6_9BACT|nr:DUF5723 family protein [Hymenobacter busanensis]KAA9338344.1 hypothetical protein F0P96_05785 [Hymenobacter busanensis]QHJ09230.1 hypothetical protein GUY19_18825 [Hymenobacter busanensis]